MQDDDQYAAPKMPTPAFKKKTQPKPKQARLSPAAADRINEKVDRLTQR